MNTEEFLRTGGIDASRPAMRKSFATSTLMSTDVQWAVIEASKNGKDRPGDETTAQCLLDGYNAYGEWAIQEHLKRMLDRNDFQKWKGIRAAKAKRLLKEWARHYYYIKEQSE